MGGAKANTREVIASAVRSAEMSRSVPAESVSFAVLGGMGLGAALLAGGYLAGWLAQKKVREHKLKLIA